MVCSNIRNSVNYIPLSYLGVAPNVSAGLIDLYPLIEVLFWPCQLQHLLEMTEVLACDSAVATLALPGWSFNSCTV
jgi:hypothetical protein